MRWFEMLGSLAWLLPMLGLTQFSAEGDGGGSGEGGGGSGEGGGEGGRTQLTSVGKGEGERGTPDWRDQIPENIRSEGVFANVKDVSDLSTQFFNAQKMVGIDKIAKPRDDWKDEDWSKHYNMLGRPETVEKYTKPSIELPEGMKLNDEIINNALKTFHKAGFNQKQSDTIFGFYADLINGQVSSATEESEKGQREAMSALKTEFGDKYAENLDVAKNVLKKFGDDEMIKLLDDTGLGDNPAMIKFLSKAGAAILEDHAEGRGKGLDTHTETGAKQEIERLKGDKEFQKVLMTREEVGHKEAVAKWADLHKRSYGTAFVT